MKKIIVSFLASIFLITGYHHVQAGNILVGFSGSTMIATYITPLSSDLKLRLGLGTTLPKTGETGYSFRLGATVAQLMGLNFDLDLAKPTTAGSKMTTNLLISKTYATKINDDLKLGVTLTFLNYELDGPTKLFVSVAPVVIATVDF